VICTQRDTLSFRLKSYIASHDGLAKFVPALT